MRIGSLRVLDNQDLYPIDEEMSSSTLNYKAQKVWNRTDKSKPGALFWTTMRASLPAFLYGVFPRLCLIGFRYAQPFLLSRTVNFASNPTEPDAVGWALTGAFGLVFVGLAVSNGSYCMCPTPNCIPYLRMRQLRPNILQDHMTYRFVTSVRGTLVSMIYTKTIDLSITALDESAAVTLMASDTGTSL